jgi:hypothetical protein
MKFFGRLKYLVVPAVMLMASIMCSVPAQAHGLFDFLAPPVYVEQPQIYVAPQPSYQQPPGYYAPQPAYGQPQSYYAPQQSYGQQPYYSQQVQENTEPGFTCIAPPYHCTLPTMNQVNGPCTCLRQDGAVFRGRTE